MFTGSLSLSQGCLLLVVDFSVEELGELINFVREFAGADKFSEICFDGGDWRLEIFCDFVHADDFIGVNVLFKRF
jgi:hypothetical protein